MTKETCGRAVVDDQLTLVTDVMVEKGIEAVKEIAGLIQLKEAFLGEWVAAYDTHRANYNQKKSMRAILGGPYKNAWDSWPDRVWKLDNESVVLVQTDIHQDKKQATSWL